jgi:hypothetical protein
MFITLTTFAGKNPVLVPVDNIAYVVQLGDQGTHIGLKIGPDVVVMQPVALIQAKIDQEARAVARLRLSDG